MRSLYSHRTGYKTVLIGFTETPIQQFNWSHFLSIFAAHSLGILIAPTPPGSATVTVLCTWECAPAVTAALSAAHSVLHACPVDCTAPWTVAPPTAAAGVGGPPGTGVGATATAVCGC